MLKWLFGRKETEAGREGTVSAPGEAPDARLGPEPPPPPSANRPGVTVHAATAEADVPPGPFRPGATRLGLHAGGSLDPRLAWAALVLSGEDAGDVVVGAGAGLDLGEGTRVLLDGVPGTGEDAPVRIRRDALSGSGVPGISGARLLARGPSRAVLRLGPPPAARWAVVGLRSVAVLVGRMTLVDGEEGRDVRAGQVALVADPTATLYLQAGNDAAVAVAFASADVLVRLG
ncbi:MAG: hypothetical protein U0529_21430 [Thermoanaerobaculia bacterium]